ncbi:TonB-dependent receptor [Novosphingobium colocasiae]|uniref:TonB-dependent receptor n=1 Tax=Novosphingobium colocasiae TaxID=1256513 RepID=A0A918UCT1_9SPHN|nr:TonB-dependent receptor [Novosphingobium colocasiae]GGY90291.1 TonB-dependent receptor [Novosphingobium colocasiae]
MKLIHRTILFAGCSAMALGAAATSAAAQTAEGAADAGNEIVVTANKREQNLSEVGSSVSAVSGEALKLQQISSVADLAKITPGLTFAPTPNATPVYTIRGVGFYDSSLASYPDVAVYLDQFPLALPVMSSQTGFDLQRVEVLKGPQGTLFGNNATGGAINFVANAPTKDMSGGANLSYGRFNAVDFNAFVSGPLSDTLRARLAVKKAYADPWQKSYTRDDRNGKTDVMAGRFILEFEPSSDFKASINLNGWRDQSEPQAPQKIAYVPQNDVSGTPAGAPAGSGPVPYPQATYPNSPMNARSADWTAGQYSPSQDNRFKQALGRFDYTFGSITLTSLTGYSDMKFRNTTEGGGTALVDLDLRNDQGKIKSFTQELRIANDPKSALRWVLGANYENTKVDETTYLSYADTSSTYVNGIVTSNYQTNQRMKNYAAFGNIEFDVMDNLTFKAGIRRTQAKRFATAFNGDLASGPILPTDTTFGGTPGVSLTNFFNAVYDSLQELYGGAGYNIPTIAPGGSIILDTRGLVLGDPASNDPVNPDTFLTADIVRTKIKENSTSWMLGADFKPVDGLLLYSNVSKGYKAGSFPHLSGAIFDAYAPVKQESILAYEAGFKAQLMGNAISINGAAFYYDYKNKQTRAKFVDPIFGALDKLLNVPKSRIKGAEIEVSGRPVEGLTISASATYLDAKVKRYVGAVDSVLVSGVRVPVNASFAGVDLPFSPEWQYSIRADYQFPVSSYVDAFLGVGANGQSKSVSALVVPGSTTFGADSDLYKIKAYTLVNGNIGVKSADGTWTASVWGKNIFNKYYWSNATQAYDTFVRYTGRPAEYGVSLGFNF